MIRIENVCKQVNGTHILKNVSLEIDGGKTTGIIGSSGCGKTTLLMSICGLTEFTSGSITVLDKTLVPVAPLGKSAALLEYRKPIGVVFQSLALFPHFTVMQNIIEAPVQVNKVSRGEAEADALELLAKLELEPHAAKYPHELSGGEQQRVAILRALAMKPEILLLDEPTSALDPKKSNDVRALFREYVNQGHTLVIVSHAIRFLKGIADTLAFFDSGELVETGPLEKLMENPADNRLRNFLSHAEGD